MPPTISVRLRSGWLVLVGTALTIVELSRTVETPTMMGASSSPPVETAVCEVPLALLGGVGVAPFSGMKPEPVPASGRGGLKDGSSDVVDAGVGLTIGPRRPSVPRSPPESGAVVDEPDEVDPSFATLSSLSESIEELLVELVLELFAVLDEVGSAGARGSKPEGPSKESSRPPSSVVDVVDGDSGVFLSGGSKGGDVVLSDSSSERSTYVLVEVVRGRGVVVL